ncbi:MAG: cysteine-rich CWC family protein [Leptospiraceae bacterium]|nr:cysteine-rich CWC family protein [Leptospiraceae bacterium]
MAAGKNDCWCFAVSIPPELMEAIPDDQKGKACLCRECISEK